MKATSDTKPNIVETYIEFATKRYAVNIDVAHTIDGWEYDRVIIPAGKWNYSGVVDALVQYKYPIDKMQAWRKEAKEIAKEALLYELS